VTTDVSYANRVRADGNGETYEPKKMREGVTEGHRDRVQAQRHWGGTRKTNLILQKPRSPGGRGRDHKKKEKQKANQTRALRV